MIDEVAACESPQKEHLSRSTLEALDVCRVEVHFSHWVDLLTDVLGDVGVGRGYVIDEFVRVLLNLAKFLQYLLIVCFFAFAFDEIFDLQLVLSSLLRTPPPTILVSSNKRMFDVLFIRVAAFAKLIGCAEQTFVRIVRNALQSAS